MDDKKPISDLSSAHHVEDEKRNNSADDQFTLQDLQASSDTKTAKVVSVALADALAKDGRPSAWSWSMIQLYGIIVLVTLS